MSIAKKAPEGANGHSSLYIRSKIAVLGIILWLMVFLSGYTWVFKLLFTYLEKRSQAMKSVLQSLKFLQFNCSHGGAGIWAIDCSMLLMFYLRLVDFKTIKPRIRQTPLNIYCNGV